MLLPLLLLPLLWEGSLSQTQVGQLSVTLQEGMCAHVPCTFNDDALSRDDRRSVYGSWFREGTYRSHDKIVATNDPSHRVEEQEKSRFHLLGDPKMKNCSLSITDAQSSDSGKYFFHLRYAYYGYGYLKKLLYVNVTGLMQKPDISIPEMLESGNPVTVKCTFPWTCGENRPFKFSWRGAALSSSPQSSGASHSSEVSFIPGHQHHGTNLTCQVTLPGGLLSTERTVQLNVSSFSAQENSSWPLMFILLRGALMGSGFLLTYGLTWLYYTRKPLGREQPAAPEAAQCSV